MPKPTFEQALAECLRDLHEGRATVESCVERWPQFPELLGHLEVRASLGAASNVPDIARITAGAAMRRALVDRASASAGGSGSPTRLLPRAVGAAVAALILAGGAAGASAAVGGPNIPARVLSAIAALTNEGDDRGTQADEGRVTATATASADPSSRGLCVAYLSGSDRGRLQREDVATFTKLSDQAASAGQSVQEYCSAIAPERRPNAESEVPGRGAGDTRTPTPRSRDEEPNGKPPEASPGRTASPTPSAPNPTGPARGRP